MKKLTTAFVVLTFLCTGLIAQNRPDGSTPQGEDLKVPEGWSVRLDHPNVETKIGDDSETADIYFVNMTPGWHITTGPSAIFYHPENTVSGNYNIKSKIYLFDTKGRNREAFGMIFGGKNLDKENQEYVYFLIRNTGEYLIKTRAGSETATIKGWTATDAMTMFTDKTESTAENNFEVNISAEKITFYLNDQKLTSIPSEGISTDGIFGLRVNHSNNLHIATLVATQK